MSIKGESPLRRRVVSNYDFMQSLSPAKLSVYLRTRLAHNQGCPPVPLMQVFTMCKDSTSCDECWWGWLCAEHEEVGTPPLTEVPRCWTCRYGARATSCHAMVYCMAKRFYGIAMDADDYCSFYVERYFEEDKADAEIAVRLGELRAENKQEVHDEVLRRYELRQLARELEHRRKQREVLEEEKEKELDESG